MNRLGQFGFSIGLPSGIATAAASAAKQAASMAQHATECQGELAQIQTLKNHRIMAGLGGVVLGLVIGYFAGKAA